MELNYFAIRKNFEKHGFTTSYFKTKEEVVNYLVERLKGRSIGFGGSATVKELGLFDALSRENACVWHHRIAGDEIKLLAAECRIYICSVNALSETGEIVNVDGAGNRIAMTLYGPGKVYYIVGRNKIVKTREEAIYRAKNVACPKNAKKQGVKTPCAIRGDKCYDCDSPERICNCTIIMDRVPNRLSSEIIFVDEDLGM